MVDIIKIYTKNNYCITKKYDITRVYNRVYYVYKKSILSSVYKAVRSSLIIVLITCKKPIRNRF